MVGEGEIKKEGEGRKEDEKAAEEYFCAAAAAVAKSLQSCLTLCDPIDGSPFQYFCLENSMDRGAWWATLHGVSKNWTRLSD